MPRIATAEDLQRLLKTVPLPGLSAESGEEITATIRRIHSREYLACLPPVPPAAQAWGDEARAAVNGAEITDEERQARILARVAEQEAAWLASLSDDERADRLTEATRATYRIVALGLVNPELTWRHVATLHGDADVLALAILRHSGLIPEAPAAEAADTAPPPETEAAPVAA